jgi:hypothetical protein
MEIRDGPGSDAGGSLIDPCERNENHHRYQYRLTDYHYPYLYLKFAYSC